VKAAPAAAQPVVPATAPKPEVKPETKGN
jgi:hypothetical protein